MFDQPIRPEGSLVSTPKDLQASKDQKARIRAEKKALQLATGQRAPTSGANLATDRYTAGRPKSIVNRVTEYGALFNKLNDEHVAKGFAPLKTAMEVLIEAMQSDELDIKEKSKIAEKLATFESSRAPIISIEHVQNITKEEDVSAEDALDDFMQSLRKI